jgi:hypothetical protein
VQLLGIEFRIFRECHHRPGDCDRTARREIGNERRSLSKRNANATDPGVDADVQGHRMPSASCHAVDGVPDRRIDHGHDAARDDV